MVEIKSKHLLPAGFFLFVVLFGVFIHFSQIKSENETMKQAIARGCVLEYGKPECINGKINIPFYNSGKKAITKAEVAIATSQGVDFVQINGALESKKTGTIEATACGTIDHSKSFKLKWCCEKCYETKMDNYSEAVEFVEN